MSFVFKHSDMIIVQLDSEQLSSVIQNAVRKVISETETEPKSEFDQLLTIQQAADLLSLSVPTLYGLVSKSQLPVSKRGKRLYFLQAGTYRLDQSRP